MYQFNLSQWILWVLQSEGPQNFPELMALLKSDSKYGYIALRDSQFEAKVRVSLLENSTEYSQLFIQGFDYKWHALVSENIHDQNSCSVTRDKPWLELGYGPETVYGIFFPSSMRESVMSKTSCYPIKIGRTTRPLAERLVELQTGNFLDLQVGFAIHTDSASVLEGYIHDLLNHRRILAAGSQSEWFMTSLEYLASQCKYHLSLSA